MTTISYIEITQALQENGAEVPDTGTAEHRPVPLLAGKRTLARVFLAADSGDDPGVRRLRGKLSIGLAGAEAVEISSSVQFTGLSAAGADHSVLRRDLANSLNFEFRLSTLFPDETAAATGPIAVELKLTALEIDDHWTVPQEKTVAARFEPGKQLKLQMLGLRYEDEDDTVYYPDAVHFANVKNSLENLYPINGCSSSHIVVDADLEFTLPFSDLDEAEPDWEWYYKVSLAHAQLLAHRTLDIDANLAFGADGTGVSPDPQLRNTWYYGLVDYPADDFFRGAASGIQDSGTLEAQQESGHVTANFDYVASGPTEASDGLYAAHEIAHCLDLHHPGIGNQYKVEENYPFDGGFISVDRYPDDARFAMHERFLDPDSIDSSNVEALVEASRKHDSLINNATLRRIIERYLLHRQQGKGDIDSSIMKLRDDLNRWREARSIYGVEHLGLAWETWEMDRELLDYSEHLDFLGYPDPQWVSPFSYALLKNHIDAFQEDKAFAGEPGNPPNVCIIGLYNEFLGTGAIKYLFRTHQVPTVNPNANKGSLQIHFDRHIVDSDYIHHKDRFVNKLGDPIFLKAGIFKCVINGSHFKGGGSVNLDDVKQLSLFVAQSVSSRNGTSMGDPGDSGLLVYKRVDQLLLNEDAGDESDDSDTETHPFQIYRSSDESEQTEYFLKCTGTMTNNRSYIAQARFFDKAGYQSRRQPGLDRWMTLGANFGFPRYLYIDDEHCRVAGVAVFDLIKYLLGRDAAIGDDDAAWTPITEPGLLPLETIYQHYADLRANAEALPDLVFMALDLIAVSALNRVPVFRGLAIEKPGEFGRFYFIKLGGEDFPADSDSATVKARIG